MGGRASAESSIGSLAGLLAALLVLLPPVGYFVFSTRFAQGQVEAEVEFYADVFTRVVTANPEMWRFEQVRLEEVLSRRMFGSRGELRRIVDAEGRTVAHAGASVAWPRVVRSRPLLDAGAAVGEVEVARSLRPALVTAILVWLFLFPLGVAGYLRLGVAPVRAIRWAQSEAQREHESARRYRDHSEEARARSEELERLVAERTATLSETVQALQVAAEERTLAEERFRAAFQSLPDALSISRLDDGVFVAVNPGFLGLHGLVEEQVLGRTAADLRLWAKDDRESYREALVRDGAVRNLELAVRLRTGQDRVLVLNAVLCPLGGAPHVLASARDVTEAKAAEAARARLEDDLRQAQKLEALGRLAAGVAHDFNNLLTAISANVGVAFDAVPEGHPDRACLQDALDTVGRAARLTRELLAFTRRQSLVLRAVEVSPLVRGMERLMERLVADRARVELRLAAGLPPVKADPGQIEQAVMNLVVNARDAVQPGGSIQVETSRVELPAGAGRTAGPHVRIAVRDDGHGMDAATRERIFEPFFTTKASGHGTGLGLATVYGIVQQHKGLLAVTSEPGQGATFEIFLPVLDGVAPVAPVAGPAGLARGGTETVLVVEDAEAVREAARIALDRLGYRVLLAGGGEEAMEVSRGHAGAIHLLLSDVRMPGATGPQVAERLRRERPGLPVLFMTGYGGDALAEAAVAAADVVQKPFSVEELAARVRQALDRPPQKAEGGARSAGPSAADRSVGDRQAAVDDAKALA